ncbi:MAG: hypothetical protein ACYTFZ_07820 [Planctomycetota bacterium]|jgi:vacuolar-type H+-ATPase subunit E/Vma4
MRGVVEGADGHEVADQTFEARLDRLWNGLRDQMATMLPNALEGTE